MEGLAKVAFKKELTQSELLKRNLKQPLSKKKKLAIGGGLATIPAVAGVAHAKKEEEENDLDL